MNNINLKEIPVDYGMWDKFELIYEEDTRRLIHRISSHWSDDYSIDTCQIVNGDKRWAPQFWNNSESKVIRRWKFDKTINHKFDKIK